MSKHVIELIRVSTEGQAADDRAGIPAQREANRRTVERYGLEVVRKIEMVDVSGSRVLSAPEMKELFALMESPEIHGVVAKEFSRVMRPEDLSDFAILQRFIETQTILYLPDGPVDFSNKSGRLFGGIRALMAGFERSEILERMNDAKEAMRRQGKNTGGTATLPYGVEYRDGKWNYTAEAEKVREAFNQVLNTAKPYSQIARDLNIGRTNLRFILGNPIYTGWRVYSQKRDPRATAYVPGPDGRQGYRRKINRSPEETIRVHVMDGLISEDVFQRVQQILCSRAAREREIRSKNAPQYLFNGFLVCGECGRPMYSHTNQKAGYYYCKMNGTRERKKNPDAACRSPRTQNRNSTL
jgi:site-specific DNA recombinase